jgi:hypothetical protein
MKQALLSAKLQRSSEGSANMGKTYFLTNENVGIIVVGSEVRPAELRIV